MTPAHRYEVLDAWRGIAACFVALLHFAGLSELSQLPLIRHSWLFVDFFFVLSGFIIAANYQRRLLDGALALWPFMLLRFGRLYPLHLAMLALLVARKLVQASVPFLDSLAANPAFQSSFDSPGSIAAHLLLVHGFAFTDHASWNGPSWSISNEFFAYFLFAGSLLLLRRRPGVALAIAVLMAPLLSLLLGEHYYDTSLRVLRCVAGFSAGVVTWNVYRRWQPHTGSAVEIAAACAAFGLIGFAHRFADAWLSLLTPLAFAAVVFVFAGEHGAVSRVLRARPFLLIGMLSYSIYMTHIPVGTLLYDLARIGEALSGVPLYRAIMDSAFSDVVHVAYLAMVIGVSYLTYRWIENPGRSWFRRLAESAGQQRSPTLRAIEKSSVVKG